MKAKEVQDPSGWKDFQQKMSTLKLQRTRAIREATDVQQALQEAEQAEGDSCCICSLLIITSQHVDDASVLLSKFCMQHYMQIIFQHDMMYMRNAFSDCFGQLGQVLSINWFQQVTVLDLSSTPKIWLQKSACEIVSYFDAGSGEDDDVVRIGSSGFCRVVMMTGFESFNVQLYKQVVFPNMKPVLKKSAHLSC